MDYDKEYKVKNILGENKRQYLIDWAEDEETGAQYPPTWEPKSYVNKEAVQDWKDQQARKVQETQAQASSSAAPATPSRRRKGKSRRVVESSSDASPAWSKKQSPRQQAEVSGQAEPGSQPEPEIVESQTEAAAEPESADSPLFEPVVEPSEARSSYAAGEYQKFSSLGVLASSEPSASASQPIADTQPVSSPSGDQSHSVPVNFGDGAGRVVPDSQSAAELFSSSAPAAATGGDSEPSVGAPETGARTSQEDRSHTAEAVNISKEAALIDAGSVTGDSNLAIISVDPTRSAEQARPKPPNTGFGGLSDSVRDLGAAEIESQLPEDLNTCLSQDLRHSQVSAGAERLNLTTERREFSPLRTVSPSGARSQIQYGQDLASRAPAGYTSSLPSSSSPFQTQVARPSTGGALRTTSQAQPLPRLSIGQRAFSQQPAGPSLPRSSSPFASVPSHTLRTLGESAPPRPSTPSSGLGFGLGFSTPASQRIMDTSQASRRSTDSKSQLAAKLKLIQEQGRAKRQSMVPTSAPAHGAPPNQVLQPRQPPSASTTAPLAQPPSLVSSLVEAEQERRSPSQVPATEPRPTITRDEMNTSERYETLVPQAPDVSADGQPRQRPASGDFSRRHQQTKDAEVDESRNHVVPIGLLGHQRDQYPQTLQWGRQVVEDFLASSAPDNALVDGAESLLQRLRKIALHPDLDNVDTFTQYDVEPTQDAQWSIDCSAKFRFLKALLDGLRDQTLHVALVSAPGRIVQILEAFLTGINVPHRLMDQVTESSLSSDHEGLMVTLASVDDEAVESSPADVIIAMEPAASEGSMAVKALASKSVSMPLFLTLVVPGSIEHIEQSVSATLAPRARLRALVSGVWQYRKDAGKLGDEYTAPVAAASSIAQYLATQANDVEWPVADLDPLPNLDSQTESDLEQTSEHGAIGMKRSFASDDLAGDTEVNKKARYAHHAPDLPITINPQEIEITHVTNSVGKSTQPSNSSGIAPQLALLTDTERSLHRMLKEAQDKLEEQVQVMSDLQYRHEEQRTQMVEARKERDSAIATATRAVERLTELNGTVTALKHERTSLKSGLEDANARLLAHSVPERAELESLRLANEQMRAEKQQLEKRLQSAKEENEYSRAEYQSASQSAQSFATQNTDLENRVATLQNKATGEQARLRQMGYDMQTKNLRVENKHLKAVLRGHEAGLKLKDEEIARLKEASRGRMGTRGTSVPRSPRVGSPMKMDALRGNGSRQGSPAASDVRERTTPLHPLRQG